MARQVKKNLSYFTLDCDIFSKTADLRPLLRKFKADGLAVYIHILCDVYGTGYYFKPDDYEGYLLDIAEDCGISVEKVQLIIAFMTDRTLLDALSLDKNTAFTSHGIQKRYAEAMKGRKRSVAEIRGEYWLLDEKEEAEIDTFYKTRRNDNKSEIYGDKSENNINKSQIYETKEIKENNSNLNESKEDIEESKKGIKNSSYDYIIARACEDGFFNNEQEVEAIQRFIQHLCLLRKPPLNSRLEKMITRLSLNFGKDSRGYIKCVDDAINGGYTKLSIE